MENNTIADEIKTNADPQGIDTLVSLNTAIESQPTQAVEAARINSPSDRLEEAFTSYVTSQLQASKKDEEFSDFLRDQVKGQLELGTMNANQLMTILLNFETSKNDRLSRFIQPFAQLSLANKQAELQAQMVMQEAAVQQETSSLASGNYKIANQELSKEVLQGLSTFNHIISQMTSKMEQQPSEEK